ncbi:MAG: hypothetical protein PHO10_01095 [Gemmiger sp.]|nr:hypothetical protein [Gemmiger sp.]
MALFSRWRKQAKQITPTQIGDMLRLYETKGLSGRPNANHGKLRQAITLYPERTGADIHVTHPPKVSMHGGGAWCEIIVRGDKIEYHYTENVRLASKIPITERKAEIRIIEDAFYDYYTVWGLPDALQEPVPQERVTEEILLDAFDKLEPPLLQVLDNGMMYLIFEGFPPENGKLSAEQCEHFEETLAAFIGVPVIHDDRELFIIKGNAKKTIARITNFFEQFQ